MAVRMSVGLENIDSKKKINLSLLRRNTRSRSEKKSGRKAPRAGDYNIMPAPDSMVSLQVVRIMLYINNYHSYQLPANDQPQLYQSQLYSSDNSSQLPADDQSHDQLYANYDHSSPLAGNDQSQLYADDHSSLLPGNDQSAVNTSIQSLKGIIMLASHHDNNESK